MPGQFPDVVALIDGESTEQQYWQRVGHVAPHRLGRNLMADRTSRKAVVTNDVLIGTQHKTARNPCRMVLERALFEPFVRGQFAAVEICQLLVRRDRCGRCEIECNHFPQGAFVLSNRRSLSVGGNG